MPEGALVIDLSPYLTQVFLAVASAAIAFVGKAARDFIVANKENKNFGLLNDIATVAVQAAEQLYDRQDGDAKREAALDYIERELAARGIKVETTDIATALEAAVLREFNFPAAVEPAAPPTETVVVAEAGDPSSEDGEV